MKVNILIEVDRDQFQLARVDVTSVDTYRAELAAALHEQADRMLSEEPTVDVRETIERGLS